VDNWNNITNSQNRVRKKSFGGTFCFSNCHIIRPDPKSSTNSDLPVTWITGPTTDPGLLRGKGRKFPLT
jgi:hypothetical protein